MAGLAGAVLAGCHDPRWDVASAEREARINRMWTAFADREREGPALLADMGKRIDEDGRYHDERLRQDGRRLKQWVDDDVRRWHNQQPACREALRRQWQGDPRHAWETIPPLLY